MENDNNVNGNLNDNSVLDALVLTGNQWKGGIVKAVIFTLIAVIIFFVPVTVRGSTDVTFGIIYKNIKAGLGLAGLWMGGLIIMGNGLASVYGKYFCKNRDSAVYRYYQEDSVLHPLFYLMGSIFALILVLHYTFPAFEGPAAIVSPGIGETVYSIAMDVAWIIPVSAVFMPFLLNYGIVDFIGSLMEPLMRPVFKIPGRSAVNAIASFVSSASILCSSGSYRVPRIPTWMEWDASIRFSSNALRNGVPWLYFWPNTSSHKSEWESKCTRATGPYFLAAARSSASVMEWSPPSTMGHAFSFRMPATPSSIAW